MKQHHYSVATAKPRPPPRGYDGWVLGPVSSSADDDASAADPPPVIELCGLDEGFLRLTCSAEGVVGCDVRDAAFVVGKGPYDDLARVVAVNSANVTVVPSYAGGEISEGAEVSVTAAGVTRTWKMRYYHPGLANVWG